MKLRALHNHIIFQFVDEVDAKGQFVPKYDKVSGTSLILRSHYDDSAKSPRWVNIVALGPDCTDEVSRPGIQLLVDALKWTRGAKFNGQTYWRTDETQILASREAV